MKDRTRSLLGALLLGLSLTILPGASDPARENEAPAIVATGTPAAEKPRPILERVTHHLGEIAHEGDSNLYLSGYAYHLRRTYSPWLVNMLNETAWGGGFGKSLEDEDGDVSSLALVVFLDSLGEVEYNLGYMHEWRWAPFESRFTLGAGLSALVMSRRDFFDGIPFPAVLPQVSVGFNDATFIAMFVPRIPDDGPRIPNVPTMNGDVVYMFTRFELP